MVHPLPARHALAVVQAFGMASEPVMVGAQGGTIHQLHSREGELFQVCFRGTCLYCESLHVGMAHLHRMERATRREAA
jgi:hypothetical protein